VVGTLVRLKLAIARGSRDRPARRVWFVLSWLVALGVGLFGGGIIAGADAARDGRGDLTVIAIFTVIYLGWLLVPVLAPDAVDQTVDPERLEQFPVSAGQQVVGVLAGGLVAPTALFTFLVSAGGTVAAGESWPARVGVLVAAVVFTVMCVATGKTVAALVSGSMRSRRGRDVALAVSGLLAVGVYFVSQSATSIAEEFLGLADSGVQTVLAWLPPGSVAQSTLDARDEAWGTAALHLLVGVATIAVVLVLWRASLGRRTAGGSASRAKRAPQRRAAGLALPPVVLSGLRATPQTAAASQQLRYFFFRSSAAVQSLLFPVVIGIFLGHSSVQTADGGVGYDGLSGLIIGAVLLAFMVSGISPGVANVFGFDGRGVAYLVQSGVDLAPVLRGKVYAALVYLVPILLVFVVVEAAINQAWPDILVAFLAGLATIFVGLAVGALLSVWAPTDRTARTRRGGSSGGLRSLIAVFAGIALVFVIVAVLAILWVLLSTVVDVAVAGLATVAVAWLLTWGALRIAGSRLDNDQLGMRYRLLGT